jgi:hypothetical protein
VDEHVHEAMGDALYDSFMVCIFCMFAENALISIGKLLIIVRFIK